MIKKLYIYIVEFFKYLSKFNEAYKRRLEMEKFDKLQNDMNKADCHKDVSEGYGYPGAAWKPLQSNTIPLPIETHEIK